MIPKHLAVPTLKEVTSVFWEGSCFKGVDLQCGYLRYHVRAGEARSVSGGSMWRMGGPDFLAPIAQQAFVCRPCFSREKLQKCHPLGGIGDTDPDVSDGV